jgi:hypothetical protein
MGNLKVAKMLLKTPLIATLRKIEIKKSRIYARQSNASFVIWKSWRRRPSSSSSRLAHTTAVPTSGFLVICAPLLSPLQRVNELGDRLPDKS